MDLPLTMISDVLYRITLVNEYWLTIVKDNGFPCETRLHLTRRWDTLKPLQVPNPKKTAQEGASLILLVFELDLLGCAPITSTTLLSFTS